MYAAGPRTDVESPWRQLVTNDTMVVINRGVHVVEAGRFREQMAELLQWLRSAHPCATILWRSSVPGRADCNSVWQQAPLSRARHNHFDRQEQLLHRYNAEYRWEGVRQLNEVARQLIRSASFALCRCLLLVVIRGCQCRRHMRARRGQLRQLRPDSHRPGDCLHQCLPGPVDTWNRLLYNVLIGQHREPPRSAGQCCIGFLLHHSAAGVRLLVSDRTAVQTARGTGMRQDAVVAIKDRSLQRREGLRLPFWLLVTTTPCP